MDNVNKILPKNAKVNYESFMSLVNSSNAGEFNFFLFYGNPTDKEISWCPDCRTAHVDFVKYANDYKGIAKFHTVPVGSRKEFNKTNPFISGAPHLDAVPTLAVYRDRIIYLKLVDPTFEDIAYFVKKYGL
jgi:thiol-disulfide isomerase/thioredoxin